MILITAFEAVELQQHLFSNSLYNYTPAGDDDLIDDDDDDQFEDAMNDENDLHEIQAADDIGEPDPEDDDHLPDEELQ
jgi:hypothetical protein